MNNSYGKFTEPDTIRFERLLPGPIERVWAYLTESKKKGEWLAAGEVEPREGGKVTHHFNHKNLTQTEEPLPEKYKNMKEESTSTGKVTRYEPYNLLSYTWSEADGESEVIFELTEQGNEVLLALTHQKLGDNRDTLIGIGAGWHTHLGILVDRLNEKEISGFWKIHMPLEDEYAKKI